MTQDSVVHFPGNGKHGHERLTARNGEEVDLVIACIGTFEVGAEPGGVVAEVGPEQAADQFKPSFAQLEQAIVSAVALQR